MGSVHLETSETVVKSFLSVQHLFNVIKIYFGLKLFTNGLVLCTGSTVYGLVLFTG